MVHQTRQAIAWLKHAENTMGFLFYRQVRERAFYIAGQDGGRLLVRHCKAAVKDIVAEMVVPHIYADFDAKGEPEEFYR